jgi:YbbR domain-containing protein
VLKIYKLLKLNLPIEVKTQGRSPFGVNIKEIKVVPESVSVIVPSIIPSEKLKITTEPINLREIRETKVITPKLILPDEVRFADDKLPEVKVIIEVEE